MSMEFTDFIELCLQARDACNAETKKVEEQHHGKFPIYEKYLYDLIAPRFKAARVEGMEGIKEPCMDAILTTINQYRCQFTMDQDDSHLSLVDKLCPPKAMDITEGKKEIELLIDAVQGEVLNLIEAGQ